MLDRVLALVAFAFFAGFLGVIIFAVTHPMLILVSVIGVAFVAYDFATQLWRQRHRS